MEYRIRRTMDRQKEKVRWCIINYTLNCMQYRIYRMPSKDKFNWKIIIDGFKSLQNHLFSFIDIWDSKYDDNVQDSIKWILSNWLP